MRAIRISKNLKDDIYNTCMHFICETDRPLSQDYEEVRDICKSDNSRFKVVVSLEERVPSTGDYLIDLLVNHILDLVDADEDDTDAMNAFYTYLSLQYPWDGEQDPHYHYLLKATTIEALEYCVLWSLQVRS